MNCPVVLNDCNYDNLSNSSQYFMKYTNFDCFVDMTSVNVVDCRVKQNNQKKLEVVETV